MTKKQTWVKINNEYHHTEYHIVIIKYLYVKYYWYDIYINGEIRMQHLESLTNAKQVGINLYNQYLEDIAKNENNR